MAITTFDQYLAAPKQQISLMRTQNPSLTAHNFFTMLSLTGATNETLLPTVGSGTSPTVLVNHTDVGFPYIYNSGNTMYLNKASYTGSTTTAVWLQDCLVRAGTFPVGTTACTTPSISSRTVLPSGHQLETQLWLECAVAYDTAPSIQITYTSPAGASRTTGTIALGATILRRLVRIPLQAGDSSVLSIQSVTITGASVGSCNILITRPLWYGRVNVADESMSSGPIDTGMPVIFPGTALFPMIYVDSVIGIPIVSVEIVG